MSLVNQRWKKEESLSHWAWNAYAIENESFLECFHNHSSLSRERLVSINKKWNISRVGISITNKGLLHWRSQVVISLLSLPISPTLDARLSKMENNPGYWSLSEMVPNQGSSQKEVRRPDMWLVKLMVIYIFTWLYFWLGYSLVNI